MELSAMAVAGIITVLLVGGWGNSVGVGVAVAAAGTRRYNTAPAVDFKRVLENSLTEGWTNVPMPDKSHYAGIAAPTNLQRWKTAIARAESGEQVLLKKIAEVIKTPFDYLR
jgi:hypothetical protein